MKKVTLKALKQSIAHWERMAAGKASLGENPVAEHCALCQRFGFWVDCQLPHDGERCPVAVKAVAADCNNTPYMKVHNLLPNRPLLMRNSDYEYLKNTPKFKEAAQEEVEFLKSLLPDD
jgi:hypothetical protein